MMVVQPIRQRKSSERVADFCMQKAQQAAGAARNECWRDNARLRSGHRHGCRTSCQAAAQACTADAGAQLGMLNDRVPSSSDAALQIPLKYKGSDAATSTAPCCSSAQVGCAMHAYDSEFVKCSKQQSYIAHYFRYSHSSNMLLQGSVEAVRGDAAPAAPSGAAPKDIAAAALPGTRTKRRSVSLEPAQVFMCLLPCVTKALQCLQNPDPYALTHIDRLASGCCLPMPTGGQPRRLLRQRFTDGRGGAGRGRGGRCFAPVQQVKLVGALSAATLLHAAPSLLTLMLSNFLS